MQNKSSGFTLIELMVVVIIVAIFAAVATPIYQNYVRKARESLAQQEMMRLATLLDRHKARNFSYQGFLIEEAFTPENATAGESDYVIRIRDLDDPTLALSDPDASGRNWSIRAASRDVNNFSLLLTSTGIRCKNKTTGNITFRNCGNVGNEPW